MRTKTVLIISYYFPPRQSVASLRMGGLAKYLPGYNWHPVIVTAKLSEPSRQDAEIVETEYPGDASALFLKKLRFNPDNSFEVQSGIQRVAEDGTITPLYHLLYAMKSWIAYPDNQKYWYGYALKAAENLIENKHFDAIISSSQPVTSHLIAKELKQRHDIPWVADLRDLWSQCHGTTLQGPFRRWCEKRLELQTLKDADALVTVSHPLAEKLGNLHPAKRIYTVTNGFDPEDISKVLPAGDFTITYTGSLYHKQNPDILLQALDGLRRHGSLQGRQIQVCFYGGRSLVLDKLIEKYDLEPYVKQYGLIPRSDALEKQRKSQILLLLDWNDPEETGIYTGKVFEYLAARRPILAVGGVKGGVVSQLLRQTHAGIHCVDVESVLQTLATWLDEYGMSGLVVYLGDESEIFQYSQKRMAEKYAKILNKLLE